jgi:hypothetical protein
MDLIIGLAILIIFFFFGRELICWYFKINKITEILEEIRDELRNKK